MMPVAWEDHECRKHLRLDEDIAEYADEVVETGQLVVDGTCTKCGNEYTATFPLGSLINTSGVIEWERR